MRDFSFERRFLRSLMSEKSWDFFSPISFETKLSLFTLTSTYLILVRFFCAMGGERNFVSRFWFFVFSYWYLGLRPTLRGLLF